MRKFTVDLLTIFQKWLQKLESRKVELESDPAKACIRYAAGAAALQSVFNWLIS